MIILTFIALFFFACILLGGVLGVIVGCYQVWGIWTNQPRDDLDDIV
ncbi:MAG: hypothetical protein Q3966_09740 [Neisseria sp.]|nr:hypothetical protein [Neisseria sp.]